MTSKEFRQMLLSTMEDEKEPQRILEWCKKNSGKRLTERNKLEGYYIRKQYGMTHIENKLYRDNRYGDGAMPSDAHSFLVAHAETNVLVPSPEDFQELNSHEYRGVQERNEKRRAMLNNGAKFCEALSAIAHVEAAVKRYREAMQVFDSIFAYHPDRHTLEKIIGVINEK